MALGHSWAGRAFGTNTGNLFVKLSGRDDELTGTLHLNDPIFGLTVYHVSGEFDGISLRLTGRPESEVEGVALGQLSAEGKLNAKGALYGEWSTDIGSRGTFTLFPRDLRKEEDLGDVREPGQLHTARFNFAAVAVDRNQVSSLGDEMQADFVASEVVVTVAAGTEQTRLLGDFKTANYGADRANVIKLFVQELEANGVNRVAVVEFGPQVNMAMAQGTDEAWALGMLEKLKRHIQPLERTYTTNFKKLGFGINQLLFVGAIIFLPSLESLRNRTILMAGVLGIIFVVNWLHGHFLPHAAIYLVPKPKGAFTANLVSWIIAFTSALLAALLGAFLQGHFSSLLPQD